ncbi:MAG: outer membrane lipoprotein carrier protein LolA [Elusimicrobiaceae bacterium]|nr:outer membrane lipoprotein carrier protein LolA [Elusimicrobiaceae bacterium]
MKRFINKLLVGCIICCPVLVTGAEVSEPVKTPVQKDYAACLMEWDSKLNTLQTDFTQETLYDNIPISHSKGRIAYSQQGPKLRLDNLEEGQITQTALTNKKQIYILDEKGKEIDKIAWKDWLVGQPNQALFDFGNYTALLQKHQVSVTKTNASDAVLRLEPKDKEKNLYVLHITVTADTCFPMKISIESDLMVTVATLDNTQLNQPMEADTFKGLK